MTTNRDARLEALASVLEAPHAFSVGIPDRYRWEALPGSAAEHDLALELFNEKDNYGLLHHPRSLASLLVLTAAHHLAGVATLIRGTDYVVAPVLARSAYENAVIGFYILDSRIETRRRCARAALQDILAAQQRMKSDRFLGGDQHPAFLASQTLYEKAVETTSKHFKVVIPPRRREQVTVEGERQPSYAQATRDWAQWRRDQLQDSALTPDQAQGIYAELSLYVHPQSYISNRAARWGANVTPGLSIERDILERMALFAHSSVLDLAALLYRYHGWEYPELEDNERAATAAWPGEF